MTYADILLLFGSGLLAGAINALAGGGTIFTFSALVAMELPAATANATSAVSIFARPDRVPDGLSSRNRGCVSPSPCQYCLICEPSFLHRPSKINVTTPRRLPSRTAAAMGLLQSQVAHTGYYSLRCGKPNESDLNLRFPVMWFFVQKFCTNGNMRHNIT